MPNLQKRIVTNKECKTHVLTVHKYELQNQGIHTCQHCRKKCGNNSINLKSHVDKCLDGVDSSFRKLYMCPHCNHTFVIEHNMKMHSIACKQKAQGQNGNNNQACVLCGETYDNKDEHLTICSQRGRVNTKQIPRKSCTYCGKIFNNIIQHELQCKPPTACSEGFKNNVETTHVGKQSTDVQSVSNQSEVSNNTLSWDKMCKYCKKPFNNMIDYEKHVTVCQKLYSEKWNSIFETQKKYTNHLRSCNDKRFACLTCKKELKRSDSLLNHARHIIQIEIPFIVHHVQVLFIIVGVIHIYNLSLNVLTTML